MNRRCRKNTVIALLFFVMLSRPSLAANCVQLADLNLEDITALESITSEELQDCLSA